MPLNQTLVARPPVAVTLPYGLVTSLTDRSKPVALTITLIAAPTVALHPAPTASYSYDHCTN